MKYEMFCRFSTRKIYNICRRCVDKKIIKIFLQGGHSYIHLLNLQMIVTSVALIRNEMFLIEFVAVSVMKNKCFQGATF